MAIGTVNVAGKTYTHPSHTAHSAGLYIISVDTLGHVSSATLVQKSDITALGIPAQDTTYSAATTSSAGLMSANDKVKLDAVTLDTITFNENTHTITVPSTRGTYVDGVIIFTT